MTPEALTTFRRAYGSSPDGVLARRFRISKVEVAKLAKRYRLAKDKRFIAKGGGLTPMARWPQEDVRWLKANYSRLSNVEVATHLRRSTCSIACKASQLGLRKTRWYRSAIARRNRG